MIKKWSSKVQSTCSWHRFSSQRVFFIACLTPVAVICNLLVHGTVVFFERVLSSLHASWAPAPVICNLLAHGTYMLMNLFFSLHAFLALVAVMCNLLVHGTDMLMNMLFFSACLLGPSHGDV